MLRNVPRLLYEGNATIKGQSYYGKHDQKQLSPIIAVPEQEDYYIDVVFQTVSQRT